MVSRGTGVHGGRRRRRDFVEQGNCRPGKKKASECSGMSSKSQGGPRAACQEACVCAARTLFSPRRRVFRVTWELMALGTSLRTPNSSCSHSAGPV